MPAEVLATLAAIVRDVSIAVLAGSLLLVAAVVPAGPAARRAVAAARIGAIMWALAAAAFLCASYTVIAGTLPTDPAYGAELLTFVTRVPLGQAYVQSLLAAVVASLIVGVVSSPTGAVWSLVPVAWGIGLQAETGHAAGATDHHLAVTAMFVHLAGSAVWLGVLVALIAVRSTLTTEAADAVRRVSRMALWAAVALVVSGAANAWLRVGSVQDLLTTTYGLLLTSKLALMAGAIALAAWHRRVTLPRLTAREVRERFWHVLWVDAALLVGVVAIAGVLSSQAPTVPIAVLPDPTPAFLLTGYPLPPRPEAVQWLLQWRLEILSAFVLSTLAVVYVRWAARLRSRGDSWPVTRTLWFLLGIALATWVTQGAPAVYGEVTFSGHMVEHMMLVMAVPLPLTFGAPVTLALRALPARTDGSRGPREWIRVIVESRWMAVLSNPVVAAVNFAGSLVVFYYTPVFEFALRNHAGHLWMTVHFVIVGYLFANALVGIDPGPRRPRYPLRIVLLFATMAFHAFFGVGLTSSHVLLAPTWYGLMGRSWGPDAITDQQLGGALAWAIGEIPVVLLAVAVFIQWRAADAREGRRLDRQAARDDDAELRRYNEMLREISKVDEGS